MPSVEECLFQYVEAKRHLWNTYFKGSIESLRDREPLESFDAIDSLLFRALVCVPLKIELPANHILGGDAVSAIAVKAKAPLKVVPLIIEIPKPGKNRYWEKETNLPADFSSTFIEFFQWDRYALLTLSLVRCEITRFASHPEYQRRQALLHLEHADFSLQRAVKRRA